MTTKELVQEMLDRKEFPLPPPHASINPMDVMKEGMGAVLRYLECAEGPVTAGAISVAAGVSTARIAVLLKKLEEKGLIERTDDEKDARRTLISLSEEGRTFTAERRRELAELLTAVCDQVGPDRVRLLLELQQEVHTAAQKYLSGHPGADI